MKQILGAVTAVLISALLIMGQGGGRGGSGKDGKGKATPEEGIPVTSELVIAKCSGCHAKDEKGNLGRISFERSTPEGWEEALKRMVRLNGLTLTPAEARSVLKYLATNHGLAPEEAKNVMYMPEHRLIDEPIPNDNFKTSCMNCHALGKVYQWRRTREDWSLLANMHVAYFPQADAAFRRAPDNAKSGNAKGGNQGGNGGDEGTLQAALDFLGASYSLQSPEWSAWKARMRAPKLAGKWMVLAHAPGKGQFAGEMTITQGASEDEFTTSFKLQSVNGKTTLTRTGSGLVYAGYSWRGRSKGTVAPASPGPGSLSADMREVMWFSPDQTLAEGRWFWGEYQEFGLDVKLKRITTEPALLTMDRLSLKTGSTDQTIRLMGANLPLKLTPKDLDLGSGVTVKSITSSTATEIVVKVDVASNAAFGRRDVVLGLTVLPNAYVIYDKVDYLKVLPDAAMARLGGDVHPKGYQQLEAVAFHRGADGKLKTADDLDLGPIDVAWSVEEFFAVFGDDDKEFVGTLDAQGLFTPNIDGPNPQRKFSRNNYGDIWAVATAVNNTDKDGKPLQAKAYLVVTIPTYIRWDQPEVGQ